jgi:hypothetical protein
VTVELFLGLAFGGGKRQRRGSGGEFVVPIERIRRPSGTT